MSSQVPALIAHCSELIADVTEGNENDMIDRSIDEALQMAIRARALAPLNERACRLHVLGLQRLPQQDRMVLDPGTEFGIHVLDRTDPHAEHSGAQVTEVLPRQ